MRTLINHKKARFITLIIYTILFTIMTYIATNNILTTVFFVLSINIISFIEMYVNRDLYFNKRN